jgi:hypothetical protein
MSTPLRFKTIRPSTENYVKRAQPQNANVAGIRKIVSVEGDRLEADVHSASSGSCMDTIDRHEVLQGPSVRTVAILVEYRLSFSTALFPHLQLWNLRWPGYVQSAGDQHSCSP